MSKSKYSQYSRLVSTLANNIVLNTRTVANPTHVNFRSSTGYDPKMGGKVFTRRTNEEGKKELSEILPSSYKDLDLLALGGLDFDSSFHMSALLKSVETFLPKNSNMQYGAIYPNACREERFKAATNYNKDKLYYSPYIESLTRTYILPRFLNERTLDVQEPAKDLTLYSFSVGAREIMMIENCFRKILLEEYKVSKSDVHTLFSYIDSLSIAYAADYTDLPELRFAKTIFVSGQDVGILHPKQLAQDLTWNSSLDQSKIHRFMLEDNSQFVHSSQIFYLGNKTMPLIVEKNKISENGHSLPHYVAAIKDSALCSVVARIMDKKRVNLSQTQGLEASKIKGIQSNSNKNQETVEKVIASISKEAKKHVTEHEYEALLSALPKKKKIAQVSK